MAAKRDWVVSKIRLSAQGPSRHERKKGRTGREGVSPQERETVRGVLARFVVSERIFFQGSQGKIFDQKPIPWVMALLCGNERGKKVLLS